MMKYAVETLVMWKKESHKPNFPEMKCLRCIYGVSRMDIMRNKDVRRGVIAREKISNNVDRKVLN